MMSRFCVGWFGNTLNSSRQDKYNQMFVFLRYSFQNNLPQIGTNQSSVWRVFCLRVQVCLRPKNGLILFPELFTTGL
jgi:hypothetical protein